MAIIEDPATGNRFKVPDDKVDAAVARGAKLVRYDVTREVRAPAAPTSRLGAAWEGAKQGLSLGFADELAGAAGKLGAMVGGGDVPEEFREDAYAQARNEARAADLQARTEHPWAHFGGSLAGSLPLAAALPGAGAAAGARIGAGAAVGGVAGLGEAKDLSAEELAKRVGGGAALGGALGGVAPYLAKLPGAAVELAEDVAGGGLQALKRGAGALAQRAGEGADEARVLTTMGATGGNINAPAVLREAERVPGGVPALAATLRETGISRGVTTTGGILKRSEQALKESGERIGGMIDDAAGEGGILDVTALTARMRAEADDVTKGLASDIDRAHAANLRRAADQLDDMAPEGWAPIDEVKRRSIKIGEEAQQAYKAQAMGRPVAGKGKALMDERRALEAELGETLEQAGIPAGEYQAAKRVNQAARIAKEAAETSLGRAGANNLIGLTTATLGNTHPLLAVAHQTLKPLGASLRATGKEKARELGKRWLPESPADLEEAMRALGPAVPEVAPRGTEAAVRATALAEELRQQGYTDREIALLLGQ